MTRAERGRPDQQLGRLAAAALAFAARHPEDPHARELLVLAEEAGAAPPAIAPAPEPERPAWWDR